MYCTLNVFSNRKFFSQVQGSDCYWPRLQLKCAERLFLKKLRSFLSLNQDKMKWCWELVWDCGTLNSLAGQGEEGSPAVKWPTIEEQAFGSILYLDWLPPELYVVGDWKRYPPISKKLSLTFLPGKRIYRHIPSSLLLSIYRWNNQPYQILLNS